MDVLWRNQQFVVMQSSKNSNSVDSSTGSPSVPSCLLGVHLPILMHLLLMVRYVLPFALRSLLPFPFLSFLQSV